MSKYELSPALQANLSAAIAALNRLPEGMRDQLRAYARSG